MNSMPNQLGSYRASRSDQSFNTAESLLVENRVAFALQGIAGSLFIVLVIVALAIFLLMKARAHILPVQ